MEERKRVRKLIKGVVVSNKMDRTVVVKVQRMVEYPKYRKMVRRFTKFKAHDPNRDCRIGDQVLIVETRPLSKDKRWRVKQILRRAVVDAAAPGVKT